MKAIAFLLTILASGPGSSHGADPPGAAAPEATTPRDAASASRCVLDTLAPEAALVADCAACHGSAHGGSISHRVGMDYGQAATANRGRFKRIDEVSQRGIHLPGGKVACVTCHDPRSSWANHIVLPQGERARPAVDASRPESHETSEAVAAQPAPGSRISTKPLCQACHAY